MEWEWNDRDVETQARQRFDEVEASGRPARPLEFPAPVVHRAVRGPALVVHLESGQRQVVRGIIHREFPTAVDAKAKANVTHGNSPNGNGNGKDYHGSHADDQEISAYYPQRQLQDAIYGSVWACAVLRRHRGPAAAEAARAAGVDPDDPNAPVVWEIRGDGERVAIKMMVWARIQRNRGRLLEDPVKEIAAMQLLGSSDNHNNNNTYSQNKCACPYVLGSREVLQDDDFLYGVMDYCSGGDLFGVVVQYADASGGEIGMPEPIARYWFRQILMGLEYLQRNGVCHRDMSLENILVDGDTCLIIDMGMCLRVPYNCPLNSGSTTDVSGAGSPPVRRLIRPQGTCGKHNYMSPEIFANTQPFDGFAVDLWAAGSILYIMLTGFPPYDQASRADPRFDAIVGGRLYEQLLEWDVNISAPAGDLLQNMLRLDPRHRLTLEQVMNHPWVNDPDTQRPPGAVAQPWQQAGPASP